MSDIFSYADARCLARKRLPGMVFDYFDGAAGEGDGEQINRDCIRKIRLQPRVLCAVETRNLSSHVFGERAELPFGISPMGMCNLSTPGADLMLARLAARYRIPLGVSMAASTPLEAMIDTAQGSAWFQLYYSGQLEQSDGLLQRAWNAGYRTLILTVDVPEVGRRPRELRRGFKMPFRIGLRQFIDFSLHPRWSLSTLIRGRPGLANFAGGTDEFERSASRAGADWTYLQRVRRRWAGKLVVKGVLSVRDALKIRDFGIDAIQVSSHGGRQLDSAPAAIHALRRIRQALGDKFPLFYDSGLRGGEDIIKAYAMGANYVFLGRPLLFAIAAGGERGLTQMIEVLQQETSIALAQTGVDAMDAIDASVIAPQA